MKWITALLVFHTPLLSAQSKILDDPNVVWAAYITQDWEMDSPLTREWDAGVITVKHVPTHHAGLNYSSPFLADLVYDAFMAGKIPVYKDPECTIPQDKYLDYRTDTIIHFDPETFEELIAYAYEEPNPEFDINFWRVRQLIYYNKKTALWGTEVLSIAPVFHNKRYKDNELPEFMPLFWFKPVNHARNLRNKDITWAKKTFSGATEETSVHLEQDSILKRLSGFEQPYLNFLNAFENKRRASFFDSRLEHKLPLSERKKIISQTDTIVEYNKETWEGSVIIRPPLLKSIKVTELRMVQIWAWDEKKKRLHIWLDAVGPIYEMSFFYPKKGWGRPLFYQKIR